MVVFLLRSLLFFLCLLLFVRLVRGSIFLHCLSINSLWTIKLSLATPFLTFFLIDRDLFSLSSSNIRLFLLVSCLLSFHNKQFTFLLLIITSLYTSKLLLASFFLSFIHTISFLSLSSNIYFLMHQFRSSFLLFTAFLVPNIYFLSTTSALPSFFFSPFHPHVLCIFITISTLLSFSAPFYSFRQFLPFSFFISCIPRWVM